MQGGRPNILHATEHMKAQALRPVPHLEKRRLMQQTPAIDLDATAGSGPTGVLARWIAHHETVPPSGVALVWARHVLLDWLACGIAGASEPLVRILVDAYAGPAAQGTTVIASNRKAGPLEAALINGSAGHALDYDDVSPRMVGHPTAPLAPAALAVAQQLGASGPDLLQALVVGHEVAARIGEHLGASHYQQGFHTTGTIGTFAAAAACARLYRLNSTQATHCLALAATQAAGLKGMFGTMAKPLHAGKAAMNGLMAAQLAARGFTGQAAAIEGAQGFAQTQALRHEPFPNRFDTRLGFGIESTLFKYHAACFLTHPTIEAVRQVRQTHGIGLDEMATLAIEVTGPHRGVCDIDEPVTGLNVKFSIRQLAVLALDGADTASLALYSDATALDPRYALARQRVSFQVVDAQVLGDQASRVTVQTRDGRTLTATADVGSPARDLDAQWQRLVAKAEAIALPVLGPQRFAQLLQAAAGLDQAPSIDSLLEAIA